MRDLARTRAPQHPLQSTAKETLMANNNFTDAAHAAAREYTRTPRMQAGTVRDQIAEAHADGAEWARTHLAAQEPTDAEVEAAQAEVVLHAPDFTKPGVIRCHCGAPGFWSTPDAHEQHALWHALRAARRDEEDR